MAKDAHENDSTAKLKEIEDLKKSLLDLQEQSFLKEKHGENALIDSEVKDGSELQDLEKEHSAILEANNDGDFDDALKEENDTLKEINEKLTK